MSTSRFRWIDQRFPSVQRRRCRSECLAGLLHQTRSAGSSGRTIRLAGRVLVVVNARWSLFRKTVWRCRHRTLGVWHSTFLVRRRSSLAAAGGLGSRSHAKRAQVAAGTGRSPSKGQQSLAKIQASGRVGKAQRAHAVLRFRKYTDLARLPHGPHERDSMRPQKKPA